jgi:predicted nucleotide-binding protein
MEFRVSDFVESEQSQVPVEGRWYRDGDWYICRERTSRPFGQIKVEATRALGRGLAGFFTTHQWRGQVLHISSFGCSGTVRLQDGYLTTRLRFDFWGPATFTPFLKTKILSEVAAATLDVAGATNFGSKDIFIIHGHSESARMQLKTLLAGFDLNPIVLGEENDRGMTIIEKFEFYAPLCSFAFALLTPDDKMAGVEEADPRWRARQNVIFELGWFMARLGRERVMVLSQGDVEILSDLHGLIYLPFKENIMDVAPQVSRRLRDAGLF